MRGGGSGGGWILAQGCREQQPRGLAGISEPEETVCPGVSPWGVLGCGDAPSFPEETCLLCGGSWCVRGWTRGHGLLRALGVWQVLTPLQVGNGLGGRAICPKPDGPGPRGTLSPSAPSQLWVRRGGAGQKPVLSRSPQRPCSSGGWFWGSESAPCGTPFKCVERVSSRLLCRPDEWPWLSDATRRCLLRGASGSGPGLRSAPPPSGGTLPCTLPTLLPAPSSRPRAWAPWQR